MGLSLKSALGGIADPFTTAINRVIDGGAGKFGGTLNDLMGTSDAAKQTYKYNQMAADADMQRSIYLWNMQNAYNHPAAQIARMAEAGIDVNPMTYAVGNGNMSTTASNISAPGTGSVSMGSHGINPINALMSVLSGIQGLKAGEAGIEQTNAQTQQVKEATKNAKELTKEQIAASKAGRGKIIMENAETAQRANKLLTENQLLHYELQKAGLEMPAFNEEVQQRKNQAEYSKSFWRRAWRFIGTPFQETGFTISSKKGDTIYGRH